MRGNLRILAPGVFILVAGEYTEHGQGSLDAQLKCIRILRHGVSPGNTKAVAMQERKSLKEEETRP